MNVDLLSKFYVGAKSRTGVIEIPITVSCEINAVYSELSNTALGKQ